MRIIFIIVGALLLNACSTPRYKQIQSLKIGMDKTEILDKLGNPNSAKFRFSKHEWIYNYYIDDVEYAKKLWIKNGRLIKIQKYEPNAKKHKAQEFISKKPISKKEAKEIKKALKRNKRIKKYEEGFEDLN